MAHTNSTENYGLPQWIGTDKPTFLGDFNTAFGTIDTQMKSNADAASSAVSTANSASAVASSANTNATTALNTANSAATDAAGAVTTANGAVTTANTAKTNADNALRASAANTITNLAPAYDNTLTYNVGDLVTFVDAQNSGKMYKCIVAVNTPMDFNINYWDDVTVSEVIDALDDKYGGKAVMLASAGPADGRTWSSAFGALVGSIDTTAPSNVEYFLVRRTSSAKTFYREVFRSSDRISFVGVLSQAYPTSASQYQYRFENFVFENFYNTYTSENVNMIRECGIRTTQTGSYSPESFINNIYTDNTFGDATLELWMIVH